MRKPQRAFLFAIATLLMAGGAGWWWSTRGPTESRERLGETVPGPEGANPEQPEPVRPRSQTDSVTFAEWSEALDRLTPAEQVDTLLAFLASGEDGSTGAPFRVGPGGNLATAPTWRVAAIDALASADPQAAAEHAEIIFTNSDSPDEWAVALRNYGRTLANPREEPSFTARLVELLDRDDWRAQPSAGYLEAFDAVVYGANPRVVRRLASFRREGVPSAPARAARMALNAIGRAHPAMVASLIIEDESFLASDPRLRTGAIARLNVRLPEERRLLEQFLLSPKATSDDWQVFVALYPNANTVGGHFLLTAPQATELRSQAPRDLEAWKAVREWRGDPRFGAHMEALNKLEDKLEDWLEGAIRGGHLPAEVLD